MVSRSNVMMLLNVKVGCDLDPGVTPPPPCLYERTFDVQDATEPIRTESGQRNSRHRSLSQTHSNFSGTVAGDRLT